MKNKFDGFPSTKPWVAFHPIYDGHHWKDFDTYEELATFCTIDRLDEWSEQLL